MEGINFAGWMEPNNEVKQETNVRGEIGEKIEDEVCSFWRAFGVRIVRFSACVIVYYPNQTYTRNIITRYRIKCRVIWRQFRLIA